MELVLRQAMIMAVALAFCAPPVAADVVYVDADATGANDGTSWADAFVDLQGALQGASAGDQIWVAEGTYQPSVPTDGGDPRTATFLLVDGVEHYAGFAGNETSLSQRDADAHPTVLDGDLGIPRDPSDNAYHVTGMVATGPATRLDGFVITHGNANGAGSGAVFLKNRGGGLMSDGAAGTVQNTRFVDNASVSGAGGAYAHGGPLVFEDCAFTGNDALPSASGVSGGGLQLIGGVHEVRGCTFEDNTSETGGALAVSSTASGSQVIDCQFVGNTGLGFTGNAGTGATVILGDGSDLRGCLFEGNTSPSGIGALSLSFADDNVIEDCTFIGNQGAYAGALNVHVSTDTLVSSCTFDGNVGPTRGGAVSMIFSDPVFVNCVFQRNDSDWGGAMAVTGGQSGFDVVGSNPIVVNCTFAANTAKRGGAIYVNANSEPRIINSTLYGNTASAFGGGSYGIRFPGVFGPGDPIIHFENSILWQNEDSQGIDESAQVFHPSGPNGVTLPNYTTLEGLTGALGGVGNLGLDPLFLDPDGADDVLGTSDDDLRLGAGSPCVDAADNAQLIGDPSDLDCDGDADELLPLDATAVARLSDDPFVADTGSGAAPIVDMGSHERGAWENVGAGTAGDLGPPCLVGRGNLVGNTPTSIEHTGMPANTVTSLYIGLGSLFLPYVGGTLVPTPDIVLLGIPTGPLGSVTIAGNFPPGVPPGFEFWVQMWPTDASGPKGYTASNGIKATTP